MQPRLGGRLCRLLEEFAGPDVLDDDTDRQLAMRVESRWQDRARCVGRNTESWFPDPITTTDPFVAGICAGCPVRVSCAVSAVLYDEEGIWGGTRRGQRLHARARLLAGDPVPDVLVELLSSPPAGTEYALPDPVVPPDAAPGPEPLPEVGWRAAS